MNSLLAGLAAGAPLIFPGSGLVAGGIGGSVTLPDGTTVPAIAAVLRASQGNNNLNILSSPHLLTQNNKEAEIIVAENIPFITSQSATRRTSPTSSTPSSARTSASRCGSRPTSTRANS